MKTGRNKLVVERFAEALLDRDTDRLQTFFSPSSIFEPVQDSARVGIDAIVDTLLPARWRIEHIDEQASGEVILRRVQRCRVDGQWREQAVVGRIEIQGSKITRWRDEAPVSPG